MGSCAERPTIVGGEGEKRDGTRTLKPLLISHGGFWWAFGKSFYFYEKSKKNLNPQQFYRIKLVAPIITRPHGFGLLKRFIRII